MTFHDDARLDASRVRRRRRGGAAVGVGGGTLLVLFLVAQLTGVDLTGLLGGEGGDPGAVPTAEDTSLEERCQTGADANADVECRMVGAYVSLDDYWTEEYPRLGGEYVSPGMELFTDGTSTGCGQASSAMGPFYCPPDQGIYLDPTFFSQLTGRLGAQGGPLAEMYVVAHEWGHHIQNLSGIMAQASRGDAGPASDSVRLELQADCLAGSWVAAAVNTEDAYGNRLLEPFTDDQLASALDAAAAVGDDHIQESAGGQAHPESWTHGSSEQRQRWFSAGRDGGPEACDTFAVAADAL